MNLEKNMNINISERIKSANLASDVVVLLEEIYKAKYTEVHEFAAAMDSLTKGEESSNLSANVKSMFDKACNLSQGHMLSVVKLMSEVAEECGISMTASSGGQAAAEDSESVVVEKTDFQVKITNVDGMEKINAVKYLKELLGVDLKTASGLLDPKELKTLPKTFNKAEADDVVDKLASYKVFTEKV